MFMFISMRMYMSLSMLHVDVHFHAAFPCPFPCCMSYPCHLCLFLSMLHVLVLAACLCPC
jgi:hypothetical protein